MESLPDWFEVEPGGSIKFIYCLVCGQELDRGFCNNEPCGEVLQVASEIARRWDVPHLPSRFRPFRRRRAIKVHRHMLVDYTMAIWFAKKIRHA